MKAFRNTYYLNFLTRRSAIQATYQNITYKRENLLKNIFEKTHMISETKINEELLEKIIQKVEKNWDDWPNFITPYIKREYDLKNLSRCAEAILRCSCSEISQKSFPMPIIINEYLELAKLFCKSEAPIINKILDNIISDTK